MTSSVWLATTTSPVTTPAVTARAATATRSDAVGGRTVTVRVNAGRAGAMAGTPSARRLPGPGKGRIAVAAGATGVLGWAEAGSASRSVPVRARSAEEPPAAQRADGRRRREAPSGRRPDALHGSEDDVVLGVRPVRLEWRTGVAGVHRPAGCGCCHRPGRSPTADRVSRRPIGGPFQVVTVSAKEGRIRDRTRWVSRRVVDRPGQADR